MALIWLPNKITRLISVWCNFPFCLTVPVLVCFCTCADFLIPWTFFEVFGFPRVDIISMVVLTFEILLGIKNFKFFCKIESWSIFFLIWGLESPHPQRRLFIITWMRLLVSHTNCQTLNTRTCSRTLRRFTNHIFPS